MSTKFTPGPWLFVEDGDGAKVLLGTEANIISGKNIIYMNDDLHNSRLIAAAPELYEALEAMLSEYGEYAGLSTDLAVDALRKGRGES